MLKLETIKTGSSGNCYFLHHDNEVLILDGGIPSKEIKKALNWKLEGIQAMIITHGHHDHDLSAQDFKSMGIPVWQPYLDGTKSQYHQFGSFYVQSFEVPHDNEPCVGYYIKVGGYRILYATDFEYLPMSFKGVKLTDMLVECNHQKELVSREEAKYAHQIRGHCSLDTLIEKVIKENMTDSLRNIILCHYSKDSLDLNIAVEEVKKAVGSQTLVNIAERGKEVQLSLFPF